MDDSTQFERGPGQLPASQNNATNRGLVPGAFVLAIIFFFCTFFNLKCVGTENSVAPLNGQSVTGIQMVTGTDTMATGTGTPMGHISPNIWAIISFAAAFVGAIVFITKTKGEAKIGAIVGTIGFIALVILHFDITGKISDPSKIVVEFEFGYWGALAGMAVGALLSYLRIKYDKGRPAVLPGGASRTGTTG